MALPWAAALKLIPWTDVIKAAPHVAKTAKGLLQKTGIDTQQAQQAQQAQNDPLASSVDASVVQMAQMAQRIKVLEHSQRESAKLLEQMAEQQTKIVLAMGALQRRVRVLSWVCAVLTISGIGIGVAAINF